jgi:hypothetical protein
MKMRGIHSVKNPDSTQRMCQMSFAGVSDLLRNLRRLDRRVSSPQLSYFRNIDRGECREPCVPSTCSSSQDFMRNLRAHVLTLAAMLASAPLQAARAAEFVLVNSSGVTIDQLYISPCDGRHWGPNQLSGSPVRSTRAFTVSDIEPGCYDIMVVLPPWNECIMAGAELRRGLAWTISKSTVTQAVFGDCSMMRNIVPGGRRPWMRNER